MSLHPLHLPNLYLAKSGRNLGISPAEVDPTRDAFLCGCVPLAHCEQAAPLDTAGSCGICPNEAAVGSGAIVSAVAKVLYLINR